MAPALLLNGYVAAVAKSAFYQLFLTLSLLEKPDLVSVVVVVVVDCL